MDKPISLRLRRGIITVINYFLLEISEVNYLVIKINESELSKCSKQFYGCVDNLNICNF